MALESADYIHQLDAANPDGNDPKSQGDDHLRTVKRAVKNTFPNITGRVEATQAQLNGLLIPGVVPTRGMIMMWYGARSVVPAGWLICDGTQGTPNLLNRFPMGAGATNINEGATGGAENHTHVTTVTTTVAGHALDVTQIPPHSHATFPIALNIQSGLGAGHFSVDNKQTSQTGQTGGGAAHSHGATSNASVQAASNLPPFLALWFIMKA